MLRIPLLTILCLLLSGCPVEPECYSNCPVSGPRTWGVDMNVNVHPAAKASQAEIEVTITRPRYGEHVHTSPPPIEKNPTARRAIKDRAVEEGEAPYDEEVELKLFWSCPTVDKEGNLTVKIEKEAAKSKVKITDLPPQPKLAVYRWESKRGFECVIMTEDEKLAQEEEQREREGNNDNEPEEEASEEDERDVYRGERKFFIKKEPPQLQFSLPTDGLQVGSPDSYADIKVELRRDDALVVAGDRSYDMDVEVKLPWRCSGDPDIQIDNKDDTHIIIPAGTGSAEARLILPPQQPIVTLECELRASAYIDSYLIGNVAKNLEFRIDAK